MTLLSHAPRPSTLSLDTPQPRKLPHRNIHPARRNHAPLPVPALLDDLGAVAGMVADGIYGWGTHVAHFLGLGKWSLIQSRIICTIGRPLSTASSFNCRCRSGGISSVKRLGAIFFSFAMQKRLGTLNTTC
jgi:hypothetical protein